MRLVGSALAMALSMGVAVASAAPADPPPTSGSAMPPSPAWTLKGSFPDPGGNTVVEADGRVTVPPAPPGSGLRERLASACGQDIPRLCGGEAGYGVLGCLSQNQGKLTAQCKTRVDAIVGASGGVPNCNRSPVCDNRSGGIGPRGRQDLQRVEWATNLGYRYTYPYVLPKGFGGVPAVALDSKGDLWVYKRSPVGTPQLYEFGPDHRLIRTVGDDVIGHAYKAHGMAIDAHDNVWLCDAALATIQIVDPQGRLVRTIGVKGHRGDWDEAKGQRLLWQPMMVAFAPNGDAYIAEGHGNESPNDTDSDDPANRSGAARIIHLDKTGAFVNQWYGNNVGEGKFSMAHAVAVDPSNGDVWIGDREQYRIVVYTSDGRFIKTLQMRNLVCALYFDSRGQLWMGSGQDGQFLKLDREGHVLGAVGNGMGIGPGQFIEASYFVMDRDENIYAGDTSVGRITVMVAPRR